VRGFAPGSRGKSIDVARVLLVLVIAATLAVALAPQAGAGEIVNRAAAGLRDDPVYVDPDAELRLTDAQEARLESRIAGVGAPMYVAILPAAARAEAGGDAGEVLSDLHDELGERGVYAVLVGKQFRAGSTPGTGLERGEAPELATEAIDAHRSEGVAPTLLDFVDRVDEARRSDGGASDGSGDDSGGSGVALGVLGAVAVAGGGLLLLRRRRRLEAQRAEFAQVKEVAEEDLVALADDVKALDVDVEMPNADPRAKEEYSRALELYDEANRRFDRARRPEDLEPVSAALEEGRFAMASAKARLEGQEPPERRPPCFFDPRHGPSVRDVEWAPPGGQPRAVPACAADAIAVEEGREPASREVLVGGRATPYWAAPAYFGPWAGGYFGAWGGLFPGLLLGSMLGSGFGGYGGYVPVDSGDGGDGGDFGDFGGGDFGGGDFGGGGGGDF
jgi:hypothetical protein